MRRTPALLAVVALLGAGAACGRPGGQAQPPAASSRVPAPALSPLTGRPGAPAPVVAVKVDNAPSARPLHRGLSRAAVVYQELVEGGATRFLAVYTGRDDFEIGPVRSARISDIDLLAEYGKVAFAFSGAQAGVLLQVRSANLYEVSQERSPEAYVLRGRRIEAYNFYTSPRRVLERAPDAERSHDIGLRFGPPRPGGAPVAAPVRVVLGARSFVTFRWDPGRRGWRLTQQGRAMTLADGTVVAPQNLIVQSVPVRPGRFHDRLGYNSPETVTIGRGVAQVYRDGRRYDGSWVRESRSDGTRFVAADGGDVPLRPGQTWILLVPAGATPGHEPGQPAQRP